MIQVESIDGFRVSTHGDTYNTLVFLSEEDSNVEALLDGLTGEVALEEGATGRCVHFKNLVRLSDTVARELRESTAVTKVVTLSPVVPVLSPKDMILPFTTPRQMAAYAKGNKSDLAELAIAYESARGGISERKVLQQMTELITIWRESIKTGLAGTDFDDRISGSQSPVFNAMNKAGELADAGALNLIIAYVSSLMEVKSSMGLISFQI